jgi:hypothetical protein
MWTLAGTHRPTLRQIHLCWLAALFLALLLTGCGSDSATRPVLAEQCLQVGGDRHESNVSILSPDAGTLRIRVEERGISVVATLDADPSSAAESPVERLGSIQLAANTQRGQHHSITIQAQDSPDITGEVCLQADLVAGSRVSAETAFAAGGRATHAHDWSTAFDEYLKAARQFDRLDARPSSGAARQAMAEIAYLRLNRHRDSYALASQALADYSERAESFIVGALTGLRSKALFDMPGIDVRVIAPRMQELLAMARKSLQKTRFGARELPRLQIMEGFLEYRLDAREPARADFAAAAQSCRKLQDWDCYAIAGQNLALLAYESKNYTVALSAFDDALRRLPPELDPKLAADIWSN